MKLILQIAAGIWLAALPGCLLAWLVLLGGLHAIRATTTHAATPTLQNTIPAMPAYSAPRRDSPAPNAAENPAGKPVTPIAQIPALPRHDPPKAQLDCHNEQINGKSYECCLETPSDPTVRSCTALLPH
jgi:hypothetical protein